MDFIRRTIIDHETVITKDLLDSFQDGIIEAITKAEAALAVQPSVYNASTPAEFPSVGSPDVIYKAASEKRLYQWNPDELKYEILCKSTSFEDLVESEDDVLYGGGAAGFSGEYQVLDGGSANGVYQVIDGGVANGTDN